MQFLVLFLIFCSNLFALTVDSTVLLSNKYNQNQGSITINTGGTLLLGNDNLIHNNVQINLNGGELNTQGFSDTVGALTLNQNSIINLGSGSSTISFASLNYVGGALTVNNWSGSLSGGGTDRLIFSNTSGITQSFLNNIIFTGYGVGGILVGNEIVAVPEAETYFACILISIILIWNERKLICSKFLSYF